MGSSDTTGTPPAAAGPGRLWATALVAGIATGAIAWLIGEAVYKLVPLPRPSGPFGTYTDADNVLVWRAEVQNAALAFGPLGAVLGASLGLAGGVARRSTRTAAVAAAIGLVVGGVAAIGAILGM